MASTRLRVKNLLRPGAEPDRSLWEIKTALPGVDWPPVPTPAGASVLALLNQFEESQWLSADRLSQLQMRQIGQLLRHAHGSVRFYRERWKSIYDPAAPISPERFSALPLLTRRDLQLQYEALKSLAFPQQHGLAGETRTSGSTGAPVCVLKTHVTDLFWKAFTLRDHIWHRRDLSAKLAVIRHGVTAGESGNWGPATEGLLDTGRVAILHIRTDVDAQLSWLQEQQPAYLLAYPSIVAELARISLARKIRLPSLREVRTIGELFPPVLRDLCRDAWGVPVVDLYSADEVGYIALQCPENEEYHIQSEGVLVEILDDQGKPCIPGQVGRVVITALHNFATPLIRYDIGDFAEVGEPCSCGRGLPVLRRIVGRVRNLLVTAGGKRYWPTFGMRKLAAISKVLQYQFAQKEIDLLEARLVTSAPLEVGEERSLRKHILASVPPGFRLNITYCNVLPRGAGGKYEEFVSELPSPAG